MFDLAKYLVKLVVAECIEHYQYFRVINVQMFSENQLVFLACRENRFV